MSELTAQCDSLKEQIRKLEEDNKALKRTKEILRNNLTVAERHGEVQYGTKMELLKILSDTAEHLRVSKDGTNQDVFHRIVTAVTALRKGNNEYLLEVAEAVNADTTGTSRNLADSILVQFSKAKEEAIRGFEELMKTYDVDGIPALNTYIEHQLDAVTELKEELEARDKKITEQWRDLQECEGLREKIGVLEADHQAAIEGREKEIAVEKLNHDNTRRFDDAQIKGLQSQVDKYEHQAATLREDRQQCWNALRSIGGLVGVSQDGPVGSFKERIIAAVFQLQNTARRDIEVAHLTGKIWCILRKLDALPARDVGPQELLDILENKAQEGQELKAACKRLKELL